MSQKDTKLTEAEVRALRKAIYGEKSEDSWPSVRENWMKPENIRWLQDNQWKTPRKP